MIKQSFENIEVNRSMKQQRQKLQRELKEEGSFVIMLFLLTSSILSSISV